MRFWWERQAGFAGSFRPPEAVSGQNHPQTRLSAYYAPAPDWFRGSRVATLDPERDFDMRMIALALLGTVLAGACQPATEGGLPLAEQRLAAKIIDSGLLLPLGGEGLREMAGQQAQQAVMAGALAPDQFVQGAMAIERGMEPVMAEVREAAVKGLVDAYNVRELKMLAEFFATKTGDDVRAKIGPALEPSQVLMNERAQEAMGKALERLRAAWPEAGATPPPAVPGPGGPAAPAGPPVPVPPSN